MPSFNIDTWFTDIKCAFIDTLEESNVPMSYINIAKKIGLKQYDPNNWFAMHIMGELVDEGEVVKEMKGGKTKYTIPGRVYAEMPELLEELSNAELKQRLSAVGQKVGGKKAELVERLRDYMAEK
jgi:hypothetical protein